VNIVQITPGAGGMYCGNCFRDNALVAELRAMGHSTLMIPLYLPMTLDEPDQSNGVPIFFGGISVYLEQKSSLFRRLPDWLRNVLASPRLLKWASGSAAKTRPEELGEITLSMLRGEEGNQVAELEQLVTWLRGQPKPDVIFLSNALLAGMARRLRDELQAPVICMLQGEDGFLDSLPPKFRDLCWKTLAERSEAITHFIAPSRYFGQRMGDRLHLKADRWSVVFNGIHLNGFVPSRNVGETSAPVIGYFARMCREKGLHTLIDAFVELRSKYGHANLRLHVGGGKGPGDEAFVEEQVRKLEANICEGFVDFFPNLTRSEKQIFFSGLTLFSVPALYGEAFGLYVVESLAAGVPVVQPGHAAFPELVESTGGGVIYDVERPGDLAKQLDALLRDPVRRAELGKRGKTAIEQNFTARAMARNIVRCVERIGDVVGR
jgi:glycosyltransferase involved in cell wall biosynthesis